MSSWGICPYNLNYLDFCYGASHAPLTLFCISVRSVAIAHLSFTWRLPYTHSFSWAWPISVSAPCLQQNWPKDTPWNTDPSIHTTQTDNLQQQNKTFSTWNRQNFPTNQNRVGSWQITFCPGWENPGVPLNPLPIPDQDPTEENRLLLTGRALYMLAAESSAQWAIVPACIIGEGKTVDLLMRWYQKAADQCWPSSWLLQPQSHAAVATHQFLHQAQGFSSRLPTKPQAWLWALHSAPVTQINPCIPNPRLQKVQEQREATQLRSLVCLFCLLKSAHTDRRLVQTQDKTQPNDNRKHADNINNWSHSERSTRLTLRNPLKHSSSPLKIKK